jgi:hypothetical protein
MLFETDCKFAVICAICVLFFLKFNYHKNDKR